MRKVILIALQKVLKKEGVKLNQNEIEHFLEVPPSLEMGDFAFPCFFLANKLKTNPKKVAEKLSKNIGKIKGVEKIVVLGAYVNFFIDKKEIALNLIKEVLSKKNNYGKSSVGKGMSTMFEFSQPNTHKAFHVGHIRGTSIGESISRISEFSGEKITRANYSGDTGMHIAKWIWCYKKYHSKEKLKDDESWIASIYVGAIKRLGKNKSHQKEVEEINRKIESKEDKSINELWKETRKLSIDSWKRIYSELNTKFNIHYFESDMEKSAKVIVNDLVKKKIAKVDDGATIVDLNKYNLGVWVLLRRDGTVLYSAKDLALAQKKMEKNIDKFVVVIGNEQDLHFRQLEKVLKLMGLKKNYSHLSFGMVRLPDRKMSSRTGDNILYSDFIKEVVDYTKKRLKQKNSKDIDKKALIIAIGAIKYFMLKQSSNKNIIFKKEDALNFEGDSGSYIQYSYARASSILKKVKDRKLLRLENLDLNEIKLIKKLSLFKEIVLKSYNDLNPSLIAHYSYELAQRFNEFYHACPVIGSDNEILRMNLVKIFRQVLKNSLFLLGIDVLEEM